MRGFRAELAVRSLALSAVACAWLAALGACKNDPPQGPTVGTNSNWLRACSSEAECGELPACECGACTAPCSSDGECSGIEDARCALVADPAAWAECGSRSPQIAGGLCLPRCDPGSCGEGQACVSGACVLAPLPDAALCADVSAWDAGLRQREEELLALLQERRTSGAIRCGDAAAAPAPAMRYDPRLVCAARAWARDLDATSMPGPRDSAGRTTPDRLRAVGYTPRLWGDSYALQASSAERALDLMLMDTDSCLRLSDAEYSDVGVGVAGDTFVLTIGGE